MFGLVLAMLSFPFVTATYEKPVEQIQSEDVGAEGTLQEQCDKIEENVYRAIERLQYLPRGQMINSGGMFRGM